MKRFMISGNFDPFHHGHLSYIKQVVRLAAQDDYLVCIVSSDKQLMMKKDKVNIPESSRQEILNLILKGLRVSGVALVNEWDTETTLVAKALYAVTPRVFFRGGDKTLADMPPDERRVCEELGIEIRHARLEVDTHGKGMMA